MNQPNKMQTLARRFDHLLPAIVWFLAIACLLSTTAYFYLLVGSFRHAYERQTVLESLNSLRAEVGSLETEYLMLSTQVTPELALARGFRDVGNSLVHVDKKVALSADLALSATR
jgi:hypothetical protein